MIFLVDGVVDVSLQLSRNLVGFDITSRILVRGPRNNQWRSSFVNQDVVDFVDDGERQWTLRLLILLAKAIVTARCRAHVVAQVVEAEFVVGSVGDIAGVRFLTLLDRHVALNRTNRQPQPHVQRSHPLHVAAGQVIVNRDDVHALSDQRIQIGRQCRNQRLTFTGDHFSNSAAMQHHATNQLHVIVPHLQKAFTALTTNSKCFGQNVVSRFTI